jgi:hypothetical protein
MNPEHRDSQRRGRDRLRQLSTEWDKAEDRMGVQRSRFARLADPGAAPRVVSSFNLFQTPEHLAARAVELLGDPAGPTLEPSAGLGRLYRAFRARHTAAPIVLVDIAPNCCRELYEATRGDEAARLVQGDFLEMGTDRLGTFDRIVMNPPFQRGTDIRHVRHALTLLRPGGRLVTFCAAGPRQRRELLPLGQWIDLPNGSFRSEGTAVAAALMVIETP